MIRIGELAQRAGCKVVTVRYYEKEGLLAPAQRATSNYRLYTDADLDRLRFILICRNHGMSLSEIRALLHFEEHPEGTCDWINSLISRHIHEVEEQIKSLEHLKSHLQTLLKKCEGGKGNGCGILKCLRELGPCKECRRLAEAKRSI